MKYEDLEDGDSVFVTKGMTSIKMDVFCKNKVKYFAACSRIIRVYPINEWENDGWTLYKIGCDSESKS